MDGTEGFDTAAADGDVSFREIPSQIEAEDLQFATRGYDPSAVNRTLIPSCPSGVCLSLKAMGSLDSLIRSFGVSVASYRMRPAWLKRLLPRSD